MADNIGKAIEPNGKPDLEILKSETEVEIDGQRVRLPKDCK